MKLSLGLGLAAALVAGFVLGGVGPRRDLAKARDEVVSLTEQLGERASQPSPLSLLLPVPEWRCPEPEASSLEQCEQRVDAERRRAALDDERGESPERTARRSTEVAERSEDAPQRAERRAPQPEQIAAFRTAQVARIRQARAVLQEQAGLSSREMSEVDAITREMNSTLARSAEELLALNRTPSSLEMLGALSKASGVLYEGQAALEGLVGPSIAEVDASAREIFSYIEVPAGLLEGRLNFGPRRSADTGAPEPTSPDPRLRVDRGSPDR